MSFYISILTSLLCLALHGGLIGQSTQYVWQNLPVGGGGYVTGIVIHPSDSNIMYIRTDVGGAYRWEPDLKKWHQMLDWVGPENSNLIGVDGMALDPNNPDRVYLALGEKSSSPGGVYRSENRGESWTKLLTAGFDGNGREARWIGECIAVDPNNSKIIYAGTRLNGLHRSINDGVSWVKVPDVPNGYTGSDPTGVRTIVFDPVTVIDEASSIIYIGVPGTGIYRSTNGGSNFSLMDGSPVNPARMQVVNSNLYITHGTGVCLWSEGLWNDITPIDGTGNNFVALAVDPVDNNKIIAAERYKEFYNAIYTSTDQGESWVHINSGSNSYIRNVNIPWWSKTRFSSATAGMALVPNGNGSLYYTDWFGVWHSPDIWASKTDWYTVVDGHEETVVLTLVAPPSGALVYSGMADNFGFRHNNTSDYPAKTLYPANEGFSIAVCEDKPENIAILGAKSWGGDQTQLATSSNYGETWLVKTLPMNASLGKIAISSANPDLMIYVAGGGAVYYTTTKGLSWSPCNGTPLNAIRNTDIWNKDFALAADMVNGNTFYLYKAGIFYASTDGGKNWLQKNSTALPGITSYMYVVPSPGIEGEVWISLYNKGLWKSSDGGVNFTKVPDFTTSQLFSWGAPAPYSDIPTAYCYGTVNGILGLFRSLDLGYNWEKINNNDFQFPSGARVLAGDRQTFGQIYIGSGGCGIFYGRINGYTASQKIGKTNNSEFKIFPNPSTGKFYISMPENAKNGKYEIFNIQGSLLKSCRIENETTVADMNSVKGIYFIRVSTSNFPVYTERLILQ